MSMNTVYVTGLPPNVRVREVYELFIKQCGKVKYADFLPADEVCIQVRFEDPGDFEKAHRRTDLQLEGSAAPLKVLIKPPPGVQRAQNNKGKQGGKGESKGADGGKGKADYQAGGATGSKQFTDRKGEGKGKAGSSASIWVGNLPPGATDDRLKEEFQRFGTIRSIVTRGLADKRMFAYVNFTAVSSAESAIEKMHRSTAFGDPINVSFSKNPPRPPDGGQTPAEEDGDVPKRRIDLRPGPNAKAPLKGSAEARTDEVKQGAREAPRSDAKATTSGRPAIQGGRADRHDGRPDERARDRRDHGDRDHAANDRDRRGPNRERPREHDRGYDRDRNRDRERGREREARERDRNRDRTRRDAASRSRSRHESRGRRSTSHDRRASRRDNARDDHQDSARKRRRTGSGEPKAAEKDSRRRATTKEPEDDEEDEDEDEDDVPVAKRRQQVDSDDEEEEPRPQRTKGTSKATSAQKPQAAAKAVVEVAKKTKPVAKKVLKIENMPPDMTEEELRTTAAEFGTVLLCEVTEQLIDGGREGKIEYERQAELELALKKLDRRRVEGWEKRLHAVIVDDR
mmetsp:Transcript_25223/g.58033  ORF Transcript_25223/g.58033 Transcript_25223/m.58033 type:complete len:570 (+) Transcript_25223:129-1838(+)